MKIILIYVFIHLGDAAKQKRKAEMQAIEIANVSAVEKKKHEIKDNDNDSENSTDELTKNADSKRKAEQLDEARKTKISSEDVGQADSDGQISINELNPVTKPKRTAKKLDVAPRAKKPRREEIVDVPNDAKISNGKSGHNMRMRSRAVKDTKLN